MKCKPTKNLQQAIRMPTASKSLVLEQNELGNRTFLFCEAYSQTTEINSKIVGKLHVVPIKMYFTRFPENSKTQS